MGLEQEFRINSPKVISETIDGETIIINLESGHYFSLNTSGGEIWTDLAANLSREALKQNLVARYDLPLGDAEAQLEQFLGNLSKENLLAIREGQLPAPEALNRPPAVTAAFEKPTLLKYEDMQDLLLLDPIHDVDEAGWPMTKQNAS